MQTRLIPSTRGFTLLELMVTVSIIALLSGMLIPGIQGMLLSARRADDSNNMRQIATLQLTNREDTGQAWAYPRKNATLFDGKRGQSAAEYMGGAAQGADVTSISLFTLASRYDLDPGLFNSENTESVLHAQANLDDKLESEWTEADITAWSAPNSGSITDPDFFVAMDWSAPKNAPVVRPVICNRDPLLYETEVLVAYADGHTGTIEVNPTIGAVINTTITPLNEDGTPENGRTAEDIFTATGDEINAEDRSLYFGRGHNKRAHMK